MKLGLEGGARVGHQAATIVCVRGQQAQPTCVVQQQRWPVFVARMILRHSSSSSDRPSHAFPLCGIKWSVTWATSRDHEIVTAQKKCPKAVPCDIFMHLHNTIDQTLAKILVKSPTLTLLIRRPPYYDTFLQDPTS